MDKSVKETPHTYREEAREALKELKRIPLDMGYEEMRPKLSLREQCYSEVNKSKLKLPDATLYTPAPKEFMERARELAGQAYYELATG
ncbi:MAG: hypothetical protein DRN96_03890 [Thermoproteota archaeon]|nr:MAG: hypothetical protein DRN96_03890 [Candidatus Korarchaeota archaeon]